MNSIRKDCALALAVTLAALAAPVVVAWAGDPVPDIDVKMGKNHFEVQSTGDESPPAVTFEETNAVDMVAAERKETGRLRIESEQIEVLTATALSGEITGAWTGDEMSESDAGSAPREVGLATGDAGGTFTAPGITNVQQNAGVLSLQQGAVSMGVKLPAAP